MKTRAEVKSSGLKNPDEKPLHVLAQSLESTKCRVNNRQFGNLRKVLYRRRRKAFRRQPKTKEEAFEALRADTDDELLKIVEDDIVLILQFTNVR